jgi:peptide chain release factor 1
VAILDSTNYKEVDIHPDELKIETTRGSGAGGQHKNTTDSCVVITHISTGIKVVRDGRNQHANKEDALKEIKKRVNEFYRTGYITEEVEERRDQIGKGERSDKRRTYRVKDGLVIDHITGKTASYKDIQKGKIELLA